MDIKPITEAKTKIVNISFEGDRYFSFIIEDRPESENLVRNLTAMINHYSKDPMKVEIK